MNTPFPFSAIVGQDELKLAILIAAVEPAIGGVEVGIIGAFAAGGFATGSEPLRPTGAATTPAG